MLPLNIGLSFLDNIVHSLSLRTIHQTSSNNEVNISLNIVLGAEMIQELELWVSLVSGDCEDTAARTDPGLMMTPV